MARWLSLLAVAIAGYEATAIRVKWLPTFTRLAEENLVVKVVEIAVVVVMGGWGIWHLARA